MDSNKTPFLVAIIIFLISLIVGIAIFLYSSGLFLEKLKQAIPFLIPVSDKSATNIQDSSTPQDVEGHFEGLKYYPGGVDPGFYVIEGKVSAIDQDVQTLTLTNSRESQVLEFNSGDRVFFLSENGQEDMSFSEINVGDFVSYNSGSGDSNSAVWLVHELD